MQDEDCWGINSEKYNYHLNCVGENLNLNLFQLHMHSLLALFLSNQDSLKGFPPLFPFLLQPLRLFHDQIPKDVASHEPAKRWSNWYSQVHLTIHTT